MKIKEFFLKMISTLKKDFPMRIYSLIIAVLAWFVISVSAYPTATVNYRNVEISVDLTGKKSGRGAYICPDLNCLQAARKAKRLERALECAIPAEVYDAMEGEIRTGAAE